MMHGQDNSRPRPSLTIHTPTDSFNNPLAYLFPSVAIVMFHLRSYHNFNHFAASRLTVIRRMRSVSLLVFGTIPPRINVTICKSYLAILLFIPMRCSMSSNTHVMEIFTARMTIAFLLSCYLHSRFIFCDKGLT